MDLSGSGKSTTFCTACVTKDDPEKATFHKK